MSKRPAPENQSPPEDDAIPPEILDTAITGAWDTIPNGGAVRTLQGDENLRAVFLQFYRDAEAGRGRRPPHTSRAPRRQNAQQAPQIPPNAPHVQGFQQPDDISIHRRSEPFDLKKSAERRAHNKSLDRNTSSLVQKIDSGGSAAPAAGGPSSVGATQERLQTQGEHRPGRRQAGTRGGGRDAASQPGDRFYCGTPGCKSIGRERELSRHRQSKGHRARSAISSQTSGSIPQRDPPPPEPSMEPSQISSQRGSSARGVVPNQPQSSSSTGPYQPQVQNGRLAPVVTGLYPPQFGNYTSTFQAPAQRGGPAQRVIPGQPLPGHYIRPSQPQIQSGSWAGGGVTGLYATQIGNHTSQFQARGHHGGLAPSVVHNQPQPHFYSYQPQIQSGNLAGAGSYLSQGGPAQSVIPSQFPPGHPTNSPYQAQVPSGSFAGSGVLSLYPPQSGYRTSTLQASGQRGGPAQGVAAGQPPLGYDTNSYQSQVQNESLAEAGVHGSYPPQLSYSVGTHQALFQDGSFGFVNPNYSAASSERGDEAGYETGYSYDNDGG